VHTSSLIGHIIDLHDAVRAHLSPADTVARDFFKSRRYLGARDRRFISEALYAMLRNGILLPFHVRDACRQRQFSFPQQAPSIALYAAYRVKILGDSLEAVIADIQGLWRVYLPQVECAEFLTALAESSLGALESDPVRQTSIRYSMPEPIVREWLERFGRKETEDLCSALHLSAPTTIRVNTLRSTVEECARLLSKSGITARPTALSNVGLVLERRADLQSLDVFKRGMFEVQDEGSQLLSVLLDPQSGELVLDACAGGGGKTLHIAALMNNSGSIVALDVSKNRLKNLTHRAARAGVSIVKSYVAGGSEPYVQSTRGRADRVLIDAPCTGVGVYRRNPGAKLQFTTEYADKLSATQRELIERYAAWVRPGGRVVYATCSLLRQENELVVQWFIQRHPEFLVESAPELLGRAGINLEMNSPYMTLPPHRTGTDGFFAAVLTRRH
jgi:16S rRNA (cytosine967-C5)-methyltransferase